MTTDWQTWFDRWDTQQQTYQNGRELRFSVMAETVGHVLPADRPLTLLDLAAGPGSLTARLVRRFPDSEVVLLDVDPVMLAIARGVFDAHPRVRVIAADLSRSDWVTSLPFEQFDAVLTANSMHWLGEDDLARAYHELADLIAPGGVFCNADHFPLPQLPMLNEAGARMAAEMLRVNLAADGLRRQQWWELVEAEPELADALRSRQSHFDGTDHPEEFAPPVDWHLATLADAGFREAALIWRHYGAGIVAAIR